MLSAPEVADHRRAPPLTRGVVCTRGRQRTRPCRTLDAAPRRPRRCGRHDDSRPDAGPTRSAATRSLRPALALLALVGLALAGVEIALFAFGGVEPLWVFVAFVAVAVGYLGAGVVAWERRPSNRTAALLCLCAIALLAAAAGNTTVPALVTVGYLASELPIGVLLHLLLAFPSGRLPERASRVLVVVGYVVTVGLQVPQLPFGGEPAVPTGLVVAAVPEVVSAAETFGGLPAQLPDGFTAADLESRWPLVQDAVVGIQPQTPQTLATGSDHYIQVSQPDLIVDAVQLVAGRATAS